MAGTTTNYGIVYPTSTDLVKDGASAIQTVATSVDTIMAGSNYSGLVLIKTQTVGSAVASVAVTGAFSATYDNYFITVTGGTMSATNAIAMTLGATNTNYSNVLVYGNYTNTTVSAVNNNNGSSWSYIGYGTTSAYIIQCELYQPFLTQPTYFSTNQMQPATFAAGRNGGVLNNSLSYTGFTITPSTGTLTGGTIAVYGFRKAI
jgi:hypothetical protein